jgi:23S rRNA (uracil1939-C5)-methyltransferase
MSEDDIIEVDIEAIGGRGDGLGRGDEGTVFVPFTVPGDRVRARLGPRRRAGTPAELVEVLKPGPTRRPPKCAHFGACGGCALQHLEAGAYAEWKRSLVVEALARRGFRDVETAPLVPIPPGSRRRASLSARRTGRGVVLGFMGRASHRVVGIEECPVLAPALVGLLAPLRGLLAALLEPGRQAELILTATESGADLVIAGDAALTLEGREALATFAESHDLARMAWRDLAEGEVEPVAERRAPVVRFGEARVRPPPGAFLQASAEAEAALAAEVLAGVEGAARVADLFAGLGTFALRVAGQAAVHAVDSDAGMTRALAAAAHGTPGLKPVSVEARDLFHRPLGAEELAPYEAVVFDPPRAGAKAQAEALAVSGVPTVVAVSCDPATFARDARILVDGGYSLVRVVPVDQFLWSPRVELVALLRR